MSDRLQCTECGEGKLFLIEPGVRYHKILRWDGDTLVVEQTNPAEFEGEGSGETLMCDNCDYEGIVGAIEWI